MRGPFSWQPAPEISRGFSTRPPDKFLARNLTVSVDRRCVNPARNRLWSTSGSRDVGNVCSDKRRIFRFSATRYSDVSFLSRVRNRSILLDREVHASSNDRMESNVKKCATHP